MAVSLRQLAAAHFNATALCYHYSHMARRNLREHLIGSRVRLNAIFRETINEAERIYRDKAGFWGRLHGGWRFSLKRPHCSQF